MATPNQYNPNIPQSSDQLSQSQTDLLNNFGAIQALIDVNHIDFAAAGAGKHNVCEFPAPTTFAGTSGGEVALFAQTSTYTGNPVLCIQKQTNGLTTQFSESLNNPTGWTFLPSGILMIWGVGNTGNTANGNYNIPFPALPNFPVFTSVMTILVTPTKATSANTDPFTAYYVGPVTIGTPGFFSIQQQARVLGSATQTTFNYLAIGLGA